MTSTSWFRMLAASSVCSLVLLLLLPLDADEPPMPLWQQVPRGELSGGFVLPGDLTGDGRDDIVFGQLAVDSDGQPIFRRDFPQHADGIDVFTLDGETRLLITVCNTGPAYCLTADGETVWEKTQQEVSHGQAGWVGNFLPDRPGLASARLSARTAALSFSLHTGLNLRRHQNSVWRTRMTATPTTTFDYRLADVQATAVEPVAADDFPYDEFAGYEEACRARCRGFTVVTYCETPAEQAEVYHRIRKLCALDIVRPALNNQGRDETLIGEENDANRNCRSG